MFNWVLHWGGGLVGCNGNGLWGGIEFWSYPCSTGSALYHDDFSPFYLCDTENDTNLMGLWAGGGSHTVKPLAESRHYS